MHITRFDRVMHAEKVGEQSIMINLTEGLATFTAFRTLEEADHLIKALITARNQAATLDGQQKMHVFQAEDVFSALAEWSLQPQTWVKPITEVEALV